MADDDRKKELSILAAITLAWKLQLEEQFKPNLRRFFKQIARDVAAVYISTYSIPSLDSYRPELNSILRNQYRKVAKKFQYEFRRRIKDDKVLNALDKDLNINHDIVRFIEKHSDKQTSFILNTTRQELQAISSKVVMDSAIAGESLSKSEIAARIRREFEKRSEGRIDTIAMTETQISAEQIKLIESQEVEKVVQELESIPVIEKSWGSILDNKTRKAHVEADGQVKKINEPFIVGGELLKVPGDTSLGASLNNIINCRCSSHTQLFPTL